MTLFSVLILISSIFFWTILGQLNETLYLIVLCLTAILSMYAALTYKYRPNEQLIQANIVKNSRIIIEELRKEGISDSFSELLGIPVNVFDDSRKEGSSKVSPEFVAGINRATGKLR